MRLILNFDFRFLEGKKMRLILIFQEEWKRKSEKMKTIK